MASRARGRAKGRGAAKAGVSGLMGVVSAATSVEPGAKERQDLTRQYTEGLLDAEIEDLRQLPARGSHPEEIRRLMEGIHLMLEAKPGQALNEEIPFATVMATFQQDNIAQRIKQCDTSFERVPEVVQKLSDDYFGGPNPLRPDDLRALGHAKHLVNLLGWAAALLVHAGGTAYQPPANLDDHPSADDKAPPMNIIEELDDIKQEVGRQDTMLAEIDGMSTFLQLETAEIKFREDYMDTINVAVKKDMVSFKEAKELEINNMVAERKTGLDHLVQNEIEEYENESEMWGLCRRKLLGTLQDTITVCQKNLRSQKKKDPREAFAKPAAGDQDALSKLVSVMDEAFRVLEETRMDPPKQMEIAMGCITHLMERKRARLPNWKLNCSDITGQRAKDILDEGKTQVADRKVLLQRHLASRLLALQFLEKTLEERKVALAEVEGGHRWSYTQLLKFRQVAKAAEASQKLDAELAQMTRTHEPTTRVPESRQSKLRQRLLDKGKAKVELLQDQLRNQLKDPDPDMQEAKKKEVEKLPTQSIGGALEAETWLLDGSLEMRRNLYKDVDALGKALTERVQGALASARDNLLEAEKTTPMMARSFREAQMRAVAEQADWMEDRLATCTDESLAQILQQRRALEHALVRRTNLLQGAFESFARECSWHAESSGLSELINTAIRLLTGGEFAWTDVPDRNRIVEFERQVRQGWSKNNTKSEDRLGFIRRVLVGLPEGRAGTVAASAAAEVVAEELRKLRKKLLSMPGGHLLLTD